MHADNHTQSGQALHYGSAATILLAAFATAAPTRSVLSIDATGKIALRAAPCWCSSSVKDPATVYALVSRPAGERRYQRSRTARTSYASPGRAERVATMAI